MINKHDFTKIINLENLIIIPFGITRVDNLSTRVEIICKALVVQHKYSDDSSQIVSQNYRIDILEK